jgi:3',5'-cyclic AMP phosphodiesterase CpdA
MMLRTLWLRLCCVLLLAGAGCASAPGGEAAPLRFVQVTDTHLGSEEQNARTRRTVDAINRLSLPIECVVHTGDIAANGLNDTSALGVATSLFAALRVPAHWLPGNHDILRRDAAAAVSAYTNAFGPLCSQAEYHGVVFLFLCDEPLRTTQRMPGYDPLAALEAALGLSGAKPVIVFIHSPPVDDFFNNRMRPGWPAANRERFTRLVNSANVKAVVAGHFHRDELHWLGGVPLYCCAPVAGYWGRPASFRIYEYDRDRLSYRTVYLEDKGKP